MKKALQSLESPRVLIPTSLVISVLAAWNGGGPLRNAVDALVTTGLPVLIGMIVAAAGIHIATVASLYGFLANLALNREDADRPRILTMIGNLETSTHKMGLNTRFMLVYLAFALGAPLLRKIVLPGHLWPLRDSILSLEAARHLAGTSVTALCLSGFMLSLVAIFDTVAALFSSHAIMAKTTRQVIENGQPAKVVVIKKSNEESKA